MCKDEYVDEHKLRAHLKVHMREAHEQVNECIRCDPPSSFLMTSQYLDHLHTHSKYTVKLKKNRDLKRTKKSVEGKVKSEKKKVKLAKVPKQDPMCPCCRVDGGTLESSVNHISQLLNRGGPAKMFLIKPMVTQPKGRVYFWALFWQIKKLKRYLHT